VEPAALADHEEQRQQQRAGDADDQREGDVEQQHAERVGAAGGIGPHRVGGEVGADRHEARVAERELAARAVDQLQADGADHAHADQQDDAARVVVEQPCVMDDVVERDEQQEQGDDEPIAADDRPPQGRLAGLAVGVVQGLRLSQWRASRKAPTV
jgi:hypothetical protein